MITTQIASPVRPGGHDRPFAFRKNALNNHLNMDFLSNSVIMVQHADKATRNSLRTLLEAWGCMVFGADNHTEALQIAESNQVQIALISVSEEDHPFFNVLEKFHRCNQEMQILLVGGSHDWCDYEDAMHLGAAGVIMQPVRPLELKSQLTQLLHAFHEQTRGFSVQLSKTESAVEDIAGDYAQLFIMTNKLHHIETGGHIRRIGKFSQLLAELIGCDSAYARQLGEAAVWHDIGKLAIPDAILKKPGPLTPEEFEIMKTHPVLGGQILSNCKVPMLKLAHTAALFHHERWDGTGYPARLRGEVCPLEARIVGIVDVYDALTEERVYKKAWEKEKVIEFMKSKREICFEGRLVDTLLGNLTLFERIAAADTDDADKDTTHFY